MIGFKIYYTDETSEGLIMLKPKEHAVKDRLFSKLERFKGLPDGWDYGYGIGTLSQVYRKAIKIFLQIEQLSIPNLKFDATPKTDGGLFLIAYLNEDFIHIEINADLVLNLTWERGIGADYEIIKEKENVGIAYILFVLRKIYIRSCALSERYTSISIMQAVDSNPTALLYLMEESPYLERTALWKPAEQYVSI